ncbi:MAG: hypothetical protein Q7T97_08595 [Burkholderiaceae bacterium]|nr:hypothetical protein [Burkholderiaceae bacterium]
MKLPCLSLTAALALAFSAPVATAETRAAAPAARASAPTVVTPGPRLMSPAEMNENASPPGELRPENAVTPQIVIPLRKQPSVQPKPEKRNLKGVKPATAGGVNDAAARCEALTDAAARAACRESAKR